MSDAWNPWDKIWTDNRIAFLPELDGLEKEFRKHSRLSSRSPLASTKIVGGSNLAVAEFAAGEISMTCPLGTTASGVR